MSVFDNKTRRIPDYYRDMYKDGFTPDEIMIAARKNIIQMAEDRKPQETTTNINIISRIEVK